MDDIKKFLDDLLRLSTPQRPAWNAEVLLGHIKPAWNYIDGCMIKAVLEMYAITQNRDYLQFADTFIDYYVAPDGAILGYKLDDYNSDSINEGKVLFELFQLTGKEKYRLGIETLYAQLKNHPRTKGGNFWHKKMYPNQIWLDGLYMTLPFYAEYEIRFNRGRNLADVFGQFENVHSLMRDPSTGLLYHGYDEARECFWADKTTGCSKNFWTRSLGWYVMALVDTIEKVGDADGRYCRERQALRDNLHAVLTALLRVADRDTGMFYQVTALGDRPGNYLETSGSCAIAYGMMKGARLGCVSEVFFAAGDRTLRSVMREKLSREGDTLTLKDICLVAGLGGYPGRGNYKVRDGTYEYYISEPRVDNDAKGVAPFLLAFTELYRKEAE